MSIQFSSRSSSLVKDLSQKYCNVYQPDLQREYGTRPTDAT